MEKVIAAIEQAQTEWDKRMSDARDGLIAALENNDPPEIDKSYLTLLISSGGLAAIVNLKHQLKSE